jgi:hypothetical protein
MDALDSPKRRHRSSLACRLVACAVTLIASAACSSDPEPAPTPAQTSSCAQEARADRYLVGLQKKTSGGLSVSLMTAEPAPPAKGNNAWTLQLFDASGAPIEGADVSLTPYMPDHAHGSAVKPEVKAQGGGNYGVSRIYLPMSGFWEFTVTVVRGGVSEEAKFGFCIDG